MDDEVDLASRTVDQGLLENDAYQNCEVEEN